MEITKGRIDKVKKLTYWIMVEKNMPKRAIEIDSGISRGMLSNLHNSKYIAPKELEKLESWIDTTLEQMKTQQEEQQNLRIEDGVFARARWGYLHERLTLLFWAIAVLLSINVILLLRTLL